MSKYAIMPLEDYSILCDTLRNTLQTEEKIKSTDIGAYIPACVEAGANGQEQMFWDEFQNCGNRTNYRYAFFQWGDFNYNPKYPITMTSQANDVFYYANITDTKVDISTTTSMSRAFSQCKNLAIIRKLSVTENVVFSADCFANCTALEDVTMDGIIGNSISFADSPLAVASMKSIISCLKDYAGTDKEGVNTLTFPSDRWAALEADSASPTGTTWEEYINTLGWLK